MTVKRPPAKRLAPGAAPQAEETISYRMPAPRLHGYLVYFAAFKAHMGLFPPVRGDARLERKAKVALLACLGRRGLLDRPIPYALIERIVRHRLKQDARAAVAKAREPARGPAPSR